LKLAAHRTGLTGQKPQPFLWHPLAHPSSNLRLFQFLKIRSFHAMVSALLTLKASFQQRRSRTLPPLHSIACGLDFKRFLNIFK
jgi:hypothetical protein